MEAGYGQRRGPKMKPTAMHQLHGTLRPTRHGPTEHPIDELIGLPEMPPGMPEQAVKLWNAIVPQLVKAKVAVNLDSTELAAMCRWWCRYEEIMTEVESAAPYDKETENRQARLERRAKAAWHTFDSIASRYGLTPADRARLRTENKKTVGDDPLAEFGIDRN
jgi:P27 family predicted phage terminase small subunit